ncbi:MAG: InlB B-repeat-containing protein, partial [Bacteroidales bacterium]|nr:InlB B-repeat-containing protein [Bacteroidales bacterium]
MVLKTAILFFGMMGSVAFAHDLPTLMLHDNFSREGDDSTYVEVDSVFVPCVVTLDAGSGTCTTSQLVQDTIDAAVTLPSATPPSSCQTIGYAFVGWSTEIVEGATTAPELFLAGSSYTPQEDITLYAVYGLAYGSGWKQARVINDGDVVSLTSEDYGIEFDNVVGGAVTCVAFTNAPTGVHTFTVNLDENAGSCSLEDADGYYLCKSDASGTLALTADASQEGCQWQILVIDGKAILRNADHGASHQLAAKVVQNNATFACVLCDEIPVDGMKHIQLYRDFNTYSYDHSPSCSGLFPAPDIYPIDEGVFLDQISLTMSTVMSGAQIRYTRNGATPTSSSQLYLDSNKPVVKKNMTIKAKAFKSSQSSEVAVQEYQFATEYASIAAFKAAGSNEVAKITSAMRVAQQSGKYIYVCDETGGLLLYDDYGFVTGTLVDGDYINPIFGCYASLNGQQMMVLWHDVEKTGENTPVDPTVVSVSAINSSYSSYDAQLVRLEAVHFATSASSFSGGSIQISQNGSTILAVDQFGGVDCAISSTKTYDVIGLLGIDNGVLRIYPRSNEDILGYYSITCANVANGSLSVDNVTVPEQSLVTVTATAIEEHHLESLYYYGSNPNQTTPIDMETMQFEMPAFDITISGVFVENPLYTVSFLKGSGSCDVSSLTETDWQSGVVLPEATPSAGCLSQGYSFVGWCETYVNETLAKPTLYLPGTVYYPTRNISLYAVYAVMGTEWHEITTASEIVEGDYVILTKYSTGSGQPKCYYLPHEGPKTPPSAKLTTVNANNVPAAATHLWTISLINNDKDNPQYSITSVQDSVKYYLKANYDGANGIQVGIYDPVIGWEFSNNSTHGLMACFPTPVVDPSKSVRYLDLNYKGNYSSTWYFHTVNTYMGELHLYL